MKGFISKIKVFLCNHFTEPCWTFWYKNDTSHFSI